MKPLTFKEKLLEILRKNWPVRFILFPILRPKRFRDEFIYAMIDFLRFKKSMHSFQSFFNYNIKNTDQKNRPGLLIVSGRAMNISWCQFWAVLGAVFKIKSHNVYVFTSKNEPVLNLYYKLFQFKLIYIEDANLSSTPVPPSVIDKINSLNTFLEFKSFKIEGSPIGSMAMSTYSRTRATGVIDTNDPETRAEVRIWLKYIYQCVVASKDLYTSKNIQMLFFTEVFMEEYGAFYYGALDMNLNVIRFAGTVRDNAIIIQHLTRESDRTHHASVTDSTWEQIMAAKDSPLIDQELEQNFRDRYGDVWGLSSRNQPNTKIVDPKIARSELGIPADRKIGIIFSHILYDTLFFIGEDLFPSYADWFIESVKAACQNPNIEWFIKIHPSNLWRGELEQFFGGKYEEIRLIEKYVGTLPNNVHLIYPDTPYSPYTWFQLADYGITVRGTSGIELGALGKTVITAGSGRYEKVGFTINPTSAEQYLNLLKNLPQGGQTSEAQRRLGVKFAYVTFCMKPFTLDFLKPEIRYGKPRIFDSNDIVYHGNFGDKMTQLPSSLQKLMNWSQNRDSVDLLNDWPMPNKDLQTQDNSELSV